MATTFRGDRLKALYKLKAIGRQEDLGKLLGVRQSVISEWLNGTAEPDLAQLKALTIHLECTSDYLIGNSWNEGEGVRVAASRMAFDKFVEAPRPADVSDDWREQCFRVLDHEAAPVNVQGWRHLAEQIDLALGPGNGRIRRVRQ